MVDNADDIDTVFGSPDGRNWRDGLNKYLPENENGVVLFTTRSRQMAVSAAGGDVVELFEMDPGEAADYLRKSLIRKDDVDTTELLKELAYLPLKGDYTGGGVPEHNRRADGRISELAAWGRPRGG